MRVRIITTTSYPEGMAATSRIRCYAKALHYKNINVEVVSTETLKEKSAKNFFYSNEENEIPYTVLLNKSKSDNRWFNYFWASVKAYLLIIHTIFTYKRFDVCFIYVSNLWPKFLLLLFFKLTSKKTVLELNEYPAATEGNKITKYNIIKKYLRFITFHLVFPLLDGIIVISENLKTVAKQYAKKSHIIKIPILTDENVLSKAESIDLKEPYLFHAGSLSEQKDGIVKVFEAFAKAHQVLKEKHGVLLKFKLTNKTTQPETWQKIQAILTKHNLKDQIEITGYLSDRELRKTERGALALVINKPQTFQNHYNFPTKLSSYLASGRPVIAAANDIELNEFLTHEFNTYVVEPNQSSEMAEGIVDVYENPDKAKKITKNAIHLLENHFYYKSQSDRLAKYLESL